jgi:hypothetical protein
MTLRRCNWASARIEDMNDSATTPAASAATPAPGEVETPVGHCRNCGAVLSGRFCANCSQAADVHVPSTRELLHELLEGLTHSDSRLWRTLKFLWFKPGKLTQEFIAGRRVSYLPPFRLYLVVSVIFFLMASLLHSKSVEVIRLDDALAPAGTQHSASRVALGLSDCANIEASADISSYWSKRMRHACEEIVRDNGDNMLHVAIGTMPKAMFIFLPLIAFLHMLLYWRPRHRYAEHLLFFVHLHAFYFSVAILLIAIAEAAKAWSKLATASDIVQTVLVWTLPFYTLLAMRRVFNRGWTGTVTKAIALFFVYMVVFGITLGVVFGYAALQL